MDEITPFKLPEITDEDVEWACQALHLPPDAFSGSDGSDPRAEILKSNTTIDVEACPGSGKTTLLVAKLAILSQKWEESRRGICVVSHTNVARREIEERLGNTAVGQRLLSYPHFIGTIHNFVDGFLAMPWLRSLGFPIRVIDDQNCELHRRHLLALQQFSALRTYVASREKAGSHVRVVSGWKVASPAFDVVKANGQPEIQDHAKPSAKQLRALAKRCAYDGYFRFDEMFMWAENLVQDFPDICEIIRYRFPMLFIDEIQDNNERQSSLLFKIFMDGEGPVVRQRYGDSNQAIYGYTGENGATTDEFPDVSIKKDIPSSHRFGQEVADLAKPLGVDLQDLVGRGPRDDRICSNTAGQNALFLFAPATIQRVLAAYSAHLIGIFSDSELSSGKFTVVAAVHRPTSGGKLPHFLGQYWPEYDSEISVAEPRPQTLFQYITVGRARTEQSGEAFHVVDKFAEGLVRLVRLSHPTTNVGLRKRKHRHIMEILAADIAARTLYLDLVSRLGPDASVPSQGEWENQWKPLLVSVAEALCGSQLDAGRVAGFLEWAALPAGGQQANSTKRDNVFRYPLVDPKVFLRVGSIHSVKGETHTAMLVLDTFYYDYHLAALKSWLTGAKSGGHGESAILQSRLRQHYVAMTRPTHLVCLAMRQDALTDDELAQVKLRGWRVACVNEGDTEWL